MSSQGPMGVQLASTQVPLCSLGDVDGDAVGDYAAYGWSTGAGLSVSVVGGTGTVMYGMTPTSPNYFFLQSGASIPDLNGDTFPKIVLRSAWGGGPSQPNHLQSYSLRPQGVSVVGSGRPQGNGIVARIGATGVPHQNGTYQVNLSKWSPRGQLRLSSAYPTRSGAPWSCPRRSIPQSRRLRAL